MKSRAMTHRVFPLNPKKLLIVLRFLITFSSLLLVVDFAQRNQQVKAQGNIAPPLGCLLTDTEEKSRPNTPKPGYLESYIDPIFGTKITRITGDPGTAIPNVGGTWGEVCKHHYSKDQAWNADQTLLYLSKGCNLFLDGETYEPLYSRSIPGRVRWHPTEPDYMIYLQGSTLGKWNVRADEKLIIKTFSGYSDLVFGPYEGNPSWDGRWIAPLATRNSDGHKVTFAYDIENDTKYPDIDLNYMRSIDWASISALGNYVVVNGNHNGNNRRGGSDQTQVYDAKTGQKVGPLWEEYGRPSHYDLAVDENGDEVAVGRSKSSPDSEYTIKRRLKDGLVTVIGPRGSHTSTRNYRRPGWAYVSHPRSPYENEVIAIRLDGGIVERFGYIPNQWADYLTESHGSPSPDGRRVVIGSNWNQGTRPVQAYVMEACPGEASPTPIPTSTPLQTQIFLPFVNKSSLP